MKTIYWILAFALLTMGPGCGSASKETVSKTTKKEDGEATLKKGLDAFQSRNYEGARDLLLRSSKQNLSTDNLILAHKHLAFIYAIQKNPGAATKEFLKAFGLDKDFQLDKSETGNPLWTSSYLAAAKQYTQAHATGSELYSNGKSAFERRNYDTALGALESAVTKKDLSDEKRADAYKFIAFVYSIQKQTGYAKAAFRKAFKLDKNFQLDRSEYGNPVWTPLYDEVKKEFKK
jgi:Tfp pilus assembly protein PilF